MYKIEICIWSDQSKDHTQDLRAHCIWRFPPCFPLATQESRSTNSFDRVSAFSIKINPSLCAISNQLPYFFDQQTIKQTLLLLSRKLSQKMTSEASSAVSFSYGEQWCVVTGGRGFAARHLVE
jgi:hypothetical protein